MNRWEKTVLVAVALLFAAATAIACEAETGPDAPPRENGCIELTCAPQPTVDAGGD
ncbi:MAG: hypothetical protein KIT84_25665 [Labilithrix sp.]|nr:hypothetical protein [Labilithrix sp.]MCW5814441.1 hypothetical protein [Labilithrix sp.]